MSRPARIPKFNVGDRVLIDRRNGDWMRGTVQSLEHGVFSVFYMVLSDDGLHRGFERYMKHVPVIDLLAEASDA